MEGAQLNGTRTAGSKIEPPSSSARVSVPRPRPPGFRAAMGPDRDSRPSGPMAAVHAEGYAVKGSL